ncbi:MAG: hypothetical protein EPN48_12620 [Microbacteriaceae bacterium]|nr:MAG: hypothetical protein EPN48_12620 [Microbacteriaceae bacterium]
MAKRLLIRVKVTEIDDVAARIKLFRLSPLYRATMPPYQAGDHVRLRLANGMLRRFSLCGDPRDLSTYQIAVLREDDGRGGSLAIHESIRVGDELHHAAKSRDAAAFIAQLRRSLGESFHTYLSAEGKHLDIRSILDMPQERTHVYVCGPNSSKTRSRPSQPNKDGPMNPSTWNPSRD